MPKVTIYHNPRCSKSRETLKLIEAEGIKPSIILYLEAGLSTAGITALLKKLDVDVRKIMRHKDTPYKEQNLQNPNLSSEQLIQAIVDNPKILERPIIVNGDRAVVGRPPENVLNIL